MNIINEFFVSFILIKLYFKFKVCRKIKFPLLWKFYFSKWKFYFSADNYYTRMGLDLKTRELLTLVYLISLGGLDNQVKAHIQGNLNMGQSRKDLLNIIAALIPYIGYPKALNALNLLDDIKVECKQ